MSLSLEAPKQGHPETWIRPPPLEQILDPPFVETLRGGKTLLTAHIGIYFFDKLYIVQKPMLSETMRIPL